MSSQDSKDLQSIFYFVKRFHFQPLDCYLQNSWWSKCVTANGLPKYLVYQQIVGIQPTTKLFLGFLGFRYSQNCRFSCLSVPGLLIRWQSVQQPGHEQIFFCLNSFFNFLVSPRLFSHDPLPLKVAWAHNIQQLMKCYWSDQQLFLLHVLRCIMMLSELRWYTGCKLFPYFSVFQSLSFDHVSNRRLVGFPVWPRFRKLQETYYQIVISWQFSTSLHAIVQHIQKQIWRNFLIHTRSITCLLVNLSVLEKGIHDTESVATTKLQ